MAYSLAHGSRVGVFIDGRKFGNAIRMELSIQTPSKEIVEIDNLVPVELATTTGRCYGTIQLYRIVGSGGVEGAGITTDFSTLPNQKYYKLVLKDLPTDTVLYQFDFCKTQGQNWGAATKELVMGSFSFRGISYGNEVNS